MKKISAIIFCLLPVFAFPQLNVTVNNSATVLAQSITGNGVTITNANLNCGAGAAGTFTASNIGVSGGIILTTGSAADAANPGSFNSDNFSHNVFSDPDLTNIEMLATYDVCILQFDFVPICDQISITFIFGSEEYPEWVNGGFNDAFGIFLTGPDPSGGSYPGLNIATLPNGVPVSIDNVNAGVNSVYFQDNYTTPNNYLVYDGYTVPITSVTPVTPCVSYHMKIAIADAGDSSLDSGVLIASNAVSCVTAPVITTNSTPATCAVGNDGTATAVVTNYAGTPTYLWSNGQTTATINGLSASTYTCYVGFNSACGTITDTVTAVVSGSANPVVIVNSPSVCSGTPAVLTASGATSYTWSPATGLSGTTGASVTANPAATTVYTVTGTTNGCNSAATSTVTIAANPIITVNSPTGCSGTPVLLTASGAATYTWSPATGLNATTGTSVSATPAASTVYTITGTTNGCSSTATSTVTIIPSPSVTVNSPLICAGTSATLTANGAASYSWSPSTGLSAVTGFTVTATPAATTVYTVTGTSNGCSLSTLSTVTVVQIPVVTVNSSAICPGESATLITHGASSYAWNPAAGLSRINDSTVTAIPAVTTTYTITGITNGCSGTNTSTVTLKAIPIVTVNSVGICPGSSTTLTANGAASYSWNPSTGLNASQGNIVTAGPAATTVYTVTGTTNGCSANASSTVTVFPSPVVAVNSIGICPGNSATLTAGGAVSYNWSPSAGLSSTNGSSVTASPAATTIYTVTGTDGNLCEAEATGTVTVNPLPVANAGNDQSICIGESTTLTASGGATYDWYTMHQASQSILVSPSSTTTYSVVAISAANCRDTDEMQVVVHPNPVSSFSNSSPVCEHEPVIFTDESHVSSDVINQWNWAIGGNFFSDQNVTSAFDVAGTYTVRLIVTTDAGCSDASQQNITVFEKPVADFYFDDPEISGESPGVVFFNKSSTNGQYFWNFGDSVLSEEVSPAHLYAQSGLYDVQLILIDQNNCKDTVLRTVDIKPKFNVFIPNAFTPGGKSVNNVFRPYFMNADEIDARIFNRFGSEIYYWNDLDGSWTGTVKDGSMAQNGVYVYVIKIKDILGISHEYIGHVTLLQ